VRSFIRSIKGDHKAQTEQQRQHRSEHRPEIADAGSAKADSRNLETYPADEINLVICHIVRFSLLSGRRYVFLTLNNYSAYATVQ
jgi:hypothetical protein